jgi:hypothetical protein
MTFTNGHALIIGIGSYVHSPRHNVPITAADAQAVAHIVQDTQFCGYPATQVALLNDRSATRDGILTTLDRLAQTSKGDTVLLFYSGHGDYDASGNYTLTTHDTQWQNGRVVPGTAISQAELLDKLRAIPAERVLLLFNACHAGELSPTLGDDAPPTGSALPQQTASALLSTGSGRIVITACRENQYAFVGSGTCTLFAQALVEGLQGSGEVYNRNGYISAFDLYTHLYYALDEAVQRDVPPRVRERYGSTQEPELTVLKGVGPFAVARYRGASTLSDFPADHTPAEDTAVREVAENRSQRALQNIIGTATVQGDNQGQNVGVNYGTMTQTQQNIHNNAPNQGAQGTFHEPVTFNQQRSTSNQQRQTVQGNQYNANRDLIQTGGDYVGGNKISGTVDMRGVHGSGDAEAFARAFAAIYQQIEAQHSPDAIKAVLSDHVHKIEDEARKGDKADAQELEGWLAVIASMAGNIFDKTVAVLTGPQAAFAPVARKAAEKVQRERK